MNEKEIRIKIIKILISYYGNDNLIYKELSLYDDLVGLRYLIAGLVLVLDSPIYNDDFKDVASRMITIFKKTHPIESCPELWF